MIFQPSPSLLSVADKAAASLAEGILLVARLLIGWLFFTNGWEKLMNMRGTAAYLDSLGAPAAQLLAWPAMGGELLIGVLLILGLATRYASLFAVLFTIVATALAHRYWIMPPAEAAGQYIHFCKNLAIIGGLLLLFVTGAGRISIDARMR
jgi:putative oxidoreductase